MTMPAATLPVTRTATAARAGRCPVVGSLTERSLEFRAMGGRVSLRVACRPWQTDAAAHDLRLVAGRIVAWAARLTRFDAASELSTLNRHPSAPESRVGPTLSAVLRQARSVAQLTEDTVDVGLLAARLAAEVGSRVPAPPARWTIGPGTRGGVVHRDGAVTFDLDGVGKGWIADRALQLLRGYPAALVDADGDIAVRTGPDTAWALAVADPRVDGRDLARLDLGAHPPGRLGVATSGTSIHRWQHAHESRHHLIDPRTGRPAQTDVVQATVLAESALAAESLAKAIVIRGSLEGLALAERAGAFAEVILLEDGDVIASPHASEWLS
jgi:thiamine biosynthesis lipoprotein